MEAILWRVGDLDELDLNKGHDTLSIRKQYFAMTSCGASNILSD